jgi:hypothetical protein
MSILSTMRSRFRNAELSLRSESRAGSSRACSSAAASRACGHSANSTAALAAAPIKARLVRRRFIRNNLPIAPQGAAPQKCSFLPTTAQPIKEGHWHLQIRDSCAVVRFDVCRSRFASSNPRHIDSMPVCGHNGPDQRRASLQARIGRTCGMRCCCRESCGSNWEKLLGIDGGGRYVAPHVANPAGRGSRVTVIASGCVCHSR